VSRENVHAPFLFIEATVTGDSFLDMLEIWIPIMMITLPPPPFFIRVLLNRVLPQRWIGHAANGDKNLLPWPPHSLDFTPCNLFLWGFVKDSVYVPPLPILQFDYRVYVCRVTQGAHIEGLQLTHEKLGQFPLLTVYVVAV
jgi:hypothetical protein